MTVEFVNNVARQTMETTMLVSAPILLISLGVGLVVALFQAVSQVQEFTLTFVPKILAVFLSIFLFLPWMIQVLVSFTASMIRYAAGGV